MAKSPGKPKSPLMFQAREQIREAIISGRLAPGTQLKETRLSGELGISRLPIREALRLLEKEGLVESLPYRGAFVKRLTRKDAVEVFTVRGVIEELALKLMIPRVTPEMIEVLRQAVSDMEAAEKDGDLTASADKDLEFHRLICEFADNERLLAVWDTLALQSKIFLCMGKSGFGVDTVYVRTHSSLLKAIEAGDAEIAVSHLKIHISDGIEYLLAHSCYDLAPE
ncbi:MAG: GntR family transcriptional regulator [Desulfobacterales bacterium]|nr:GntR family transcriptional regulator [Desulfobacterales bacterium]